MILTIVSTQEVGSLICSRAREFRELTFTLDHNIHDLMAKLIDQYFMTHLSIPEEEATRLTREYYTTYGLAIEGLVRHHQIDPLDYNAKVDDALPLEDILKPDPELRQLLEDIDKSKVTMWLFTNAYVNHGKRVVRLLGIDDLFNGLTYCDYAQFPFMCKPAKEMFRKAMQEAGVDKPEDCYFVGKLLYTGYLPSSAHMNGHCSFHHTDDSYANCESAKELGWTAAHIVEEGLPVPETKASQFQIRQLRELRDVYPQFFKSKDSRDVSK